MGCHSYLDNDTAGARLWEWYCSLLDHFRTASLELTQMSSGFRRKVNHPAFAIVSASAVVGMDIGVGRDGWRISVKV